VQIRLTLEQLVTCALARGRQQALDDEVRCRCDADLRMGEEHLCRAADSQTTFEDERPERGRPLESRLPWVECHCVDYGLTRVARTISHLKRARNGRAGARTCYAACPMQTKSWALRLLGVCLMLLALGAGCRCSRTPQPTSATGPTPSVRLYLVSSVAGALEPCGCVKDMLGGVDHVAALLAHDPTHARVVLGAGPLLFRDPTLEPKQRDQDVLKARALGDVMSGLGLVGWAPAANDWAGGAELLSEVTKGRLELFAANLGDGFSKGRVLDVGGERIGVVGVSAPSGGGPATRGDPRAALAAGAEWLTQQGARIRIALVSMPRGEALRLAEAVPSFHVLLLGKSVDRGEVNDVPTPPLRVGQTLVVEAPNHLQSVAVVDLFVKDGQYAFADGSGIEVEEKRARLDARRRDLQAALGRPGISAEDRAQRKRDLTALDAELAALVKPATLPEGSAFRYELVEVREKLGSEPRSQARLAAYYQAVNAHNREAFKDVLPPPVPNRKSVV